MKTFNVLISEIARRHLYELDSKISDKLKISIKELFFNPFLNRLKADIKKLNGVRNPDFYRLRVGDFRVIYTIYDNDIKITEVLRRDKAYDCLD